jgi:hypothetical protein
VLPALGRGRGGLGGRIGMRSGCRRGGGHGQGGWHQKGNRGPGRGRAGQARPGRFPKGARRSSGPFSHQVTVTRDPVKGGETPCRGRPGRLSQCARFHPLAGLAGLQG